VTISVSANGPRFNAQLEEDEHGNLCLHQLGGTAGKRLVLGGWALSSHLDGALCEPHLRSR
jgi:hypothetical protein